MAAILVILFYCTTLIYDVNTMTHAVSSTAYFHTMDKSLHKVPNDIPPTIKGLYLTDNNISQINPDDLLGLNHLEFLTVPRNIITEFPNLTHVAKTLIAVHLGQNLIDFIPGKLLNMLTKLQMLLLPYNRLPHFPDVTGPSTTLNMLDISGNLFHDLPMLHAIGLNLTSLTVENVPITCNEELSWILKIPERKGQCNAPVSLSGTLLSSLKSWQLGFPLGLYIYKNNTELPQVPTDLPNNCVYLDLSHNSINKVKDGDFVNVNDLFELNLSHNQIKDFPNLTFISNSLLHLDLSVNVIESIPPDFLNILVKLKILNLKCNKLTYFPDVAGPGKSLHQLDLSENHFSTFPSITKIGQNIEYLYLYGNSINKIPLASFIVAKSKIQSKMSIHLASNKLSTVPLIAGPFMKHFTLYIYDNPLVCDYKLSWLMAVSKSYIDGSCEGPHGMHQREIRNISVKEMVPQAADMQSKRMIKGELLSENMYSTTLPIEKHHTKTLIECMTRCASTPGCMYVNYRHHYTLNDTDHDNCHIGSLLSGGHWYDSVPNGGNGWRYYAV